MTSHLPTTAQAKDQAKRLRAQLREGGTTISHGQALERVAHQYGMRDWNTLYASISNRPPREWAIGDTVTGCYLSQTFTAEIIAVEQTQPNWFRLVLNLEQAVDVVTFDSFSNFRKRISAVVGPEGRSRERTSNGQPHLVLDL